MGVTDHLREEIAIELSPNFKVTLLRDVMEQNWNLAEF